MHFVIQQIPGKLCRRPLVTFPGLRVKFDLYGVWMQASHLESVNIGARWQTRDTERTYSNQHPQHDFLPDVAISAVWQGHPYCQAAWLHWFATMREPVARH
jgi:hypothetical protein